MDDLSRSQQQRLRTMQGVATGLLALAAALWLTARYMDRASSLSGLPVWGYLSAFAEAALIGGLADWFAVVALFRRPLGLPIWHTAILPARKDDVARNLGEFVERHLITPEALRERVPQADLAGRAAQALQHADTATTLARWLASSAPRLLDSLDDARLSAAVARQARQVLADLDGPQLSERAAAHLAAEGVHQRVVDSVARGVAEYLADPEHLPAISDFLAQAMNIDNPMVKSMLKAAAPKAAQGLVSVLDDVQARADHPWRVHVDGWVSTWLAAAGDSKVWHARVAQWQADLVAHPALQAPLEALWPGLKARLRTALGSDGLALVEPLVPVLQALGRQLAQDTALRARINTGLAEAAASLASEHRGAAARFLETQLARWSPQEMSDKVELAIGRDLQFIRVNGTLVGGLVGLALHALGRL